MSQPGPHFMWSLVATLPPFFECIHLSIPAMASSPSLPPPLISPKVVEEGLKFLVLGIVLPSFLIPTAIVLFFFSTPRLRRRPAFIFNVIAIVLGLMQGVIIFLESVSREANQRSPLHEGN